MKIKTSKASIIFILVLLVVLSFSTGCDKKVPDSKVTLMKNVSEVEDYIASHTTEVDYKKYVKIKLYKSRILYNHTTEKGKIDNDVCNLIYHVYFKNNSKENVRLDCKLFLPNNLATSVIYGDTTNSPTQSDGLLLTPDQGLDVQFGTLMKHYKKLSPSEKVIFNEHKNTLYFDLLINGKRIVFVMDKPNTSSEI